MVRRRHRRYSPEFKAEALRVLEASSAPLTEVARDVGVNHATLRNWVAAARPQPTVSLTEDERAELVRLRRETQQLRMERDILKKATAFFAKQSE